MHKFCFAFHSAIFVSSVMFKGINLNRFKLKNVLMSYSIGFVFASAIERVQFSNKLHGKSSWFRRLLTFKRFRNFD